MKKIKQLQWYDKLAIVALLAFVLINPLVGQYIIQGIILAYEQLFLLADYVQVVGIVYMVGYFVYKNKASSELNIPKNKKSTAKYIKT